MPRLRAGTGAAVLADLTTLFHPTHRVLVGDTFAGEIRDGELVAEVTVTIRRHVDAAARTAVIDGAMLELERNPRRALFCNGRPGRASCEARVIAVVAWETMSWTPSRPVELRFQFVCGRHREHHGISAAAIRGTVDLTPAQLERPIARARAEIDRNEAAMRKREQLEDAASLRVRCPFCPALEGQRCLYKASGSGTWTAAFGSGAAHSDRRDRALSLFKSEIDRTMEASP